MMHTRILGFILISFSFAMPAIAKSEINILSGHKADARVRQDDRPYKRVVYGDAIVIELHGPGVITLGMRQETGRHQPRGGPPTVVSLITEERTLASFRLQGPTLDAIESREQSTRLTALREEEVPIPPGLQKLSLGVDTAGHRILVSLSYVFNGEDDLDNIPLVPLTAPEVSSREETEDLPLISLTPTLEDKEQDTEDELLASSTIEQKPDDADASTSVIGRPETRTKPASPSAQLLLGFKGIASTTGLGGGMLGGGAELILDHDFLAGRLMFGLSADFLQYSHIIQHRRSNSGVAYSSMSVQSIPVLGIANYLLSSTNKTISWQITAGIGPSFTGMNIDSRSNRSVMVGTTLSAGPRININNGALHIGARTTTSIGSIRDGQGTMLLSGPIHSFGVFAGFYVPI